MRRFLKKVFFKSSSSNGFSLIELVMGILITMLIGAAIMEGTSYYRSEMLSINIKEKAFSSLKDFTVFWKSKIATGQWTGEDNTDWREGGEVELFTSEQSGPIGNNETVRGFLYYKAERVISNDNYEYFYYRLQTEIKWSINIIGSDSLGFTIDQIVYN